MKECYYYYSQMDFLSIFIKKCILNKRLMTVLGSAFSKLSVRT